MRAGRARWWNVWRQQPYEAAVALGCLVGFAGIRHGAGSAAVTKVVPHWAWSAVAALFGMSGLLVLGGMIGLACAARAGRLAAAHRTQQTGQFLTSGCLVAIGAGALTAGWPGLLSGTVYCCFAAAAWTRAIEIGRDFRDPKERPR